jgi:glycosyltransferase involved in cell wall biosynthesis
MTHDTFSTEIGPETFDGQDSSSVRQSRTGSVTAVVCVYNEARWVSLSQTIEAVQNQIRCDDEFLVIVDHNDALLARCRAQFAALRVIANHHTRGLSGARNTAIEDARGSIIAFIDDDATPLDGWLDALRAPYADESIYGVGGLSTPHWVTGQPAWFPQEFLWVVGCSHLGLPPYPQAVRNVVGANMSFRKSAFDNVGGFAEHMGRIGEQLNGCEETEFSIRLTQANPGAIILYEPSSQVEHHLAPQRASLRYFIRRCWAEGLSKSEVSRRVGKSSGLSAERRYTSRVLPRGIRRGLVDSISGDLWGTARSAVILLGLFVTAAGYGAGTLCDPLITADRMGHYATVSNSPR